jgi:hypothetical protein
VQLLVITVDVHFIDEAWWRSVLLNPQGVPDELSGLWPAEAARQLMGEAPVSAWHTAKWDRQVARLVLGMVPQVVELVRDLTPQQLDAVAGLHAGALRLRWQEDGEFWTKLLTAARGNEETVAAISFACEAPVVGRANGSHGGEDQSTKCAAGRRSEEQPRQPALLRDSEGAELRAENSSLGTTVLDMVCAFLSRAH